MKWAVVHAGCRTVCFELCCIALELLSAQTTKLDRAQIQLISRPNAIRNTFCQTVVVMKEKVCDRAAILVQFDLQKQQTVPEMRPLTNQLQAEFLYCYDTNTTITVYLYYISNSQPGGHKVVLILRGRTFF